MLAIVIPYYKIEFFEDTLNSLASQTDKRFKVYIGDDASADKPDYLLEKFEGRFDFKYHRFEQNLGKFSLTKQWERCILLTQNEKWLKILGDDDVLDENTVKFFYENLEEVEKKELSVIRFATQKIDADGKNISQIFEHPKIERCTNFLFNKTRSSLSEYIFRKSEFDKLKFQNFPLGWFSDFLAVFEFSNYGNIYSINNSVTFVRISEFSISGNNDSIKKKLHAEFEFYTYLLNYKSQYFTAPEIDELFHRMNKCYINNKKEFVLFFRISKIYFKKKLFREYILFLKELVHLTKQNYKIR